MIPNGINGLEKINKISCILNHFWWKDIYLFSTLETIGGNIKCMMEDKILPNKILVVYATVFLNKISQFIIWKEGTIEIFVFKLASLIFFHYI